MSHKTSPEQISEQEYALFLERWLSSELPQQHEVKAGVLKEAELLESLSNKELGFIGIDGIERPFQD